MTYEEAKEQIAFSGSFGFAVDGKTPRVYHTEWMQALVAEIERLRSLVDTVRAGSGR